MYGGVGGEGAVRVVISVRRDRVVFHRGGVEGRMMLIVWGFNSWEEDKGNYFRTLSTSVVALSG